LTDFKSVATQLRCGGTFNNHVMDFLHSVPVKELLKSVNIWGKYGQKFGGTFLWPTVYNTVNRPTNRWNNMQGEYKTKQTDDNTV